MNRQKQYLADNVDAMGNVFPTVGENIRRGVNIVNIQDSELTNTRILKISVDDVGNVTTSENVIRRSTVGSTELLLEFNSNIAISSPLMFYAKSGAYKNQCYYRVRFANGNVGLNVCPFNSTCFILISDVKR